jgi:hypothetical protein
MVTFEQELSLILDKENELLAGLEECSRQKTDVLVKGNIDALRLILGREQPLAIQIKAAEENRLEMMRKHRIENITLSEAAAKAEGPYRQVLLSQLYALSEITRKIKKRNKLNNELTRSRIEFYGKLRSVFSKPMYGRNGLTMDASKNSIAMIDRKV